MAISTTQVSVSTSATLIIAGAGAGDNKMTVNLRHAAATGIVLGGSAAVTAGSGFTFAQSTNVTLTLREGDTLYGICTTSTVPVSVIATW